jgi:hypothetical protein
MKEEAGKYRQSEDALRRANQELEEKVRHQEEMLSQNTERLKQEMAQSERLEEALRQREADLRKYTHRPPTEKPAAEAPPPEPAADPVLELTLGDHVIRMDMGRETLTLGRDDKNDLVIAEDNVSRSHAVIERAGKDFFLVDRSTNGTFVKVSGKQGFLLKKNKYRLAGTGAIGLGRIVELDSSFALKFRLLQRTVPPGPQADQ